MWSRSRKGSTISSWPVGNVRRTTNPPPSTVRVAGTTLATERCCVIPGSRPVGRRLFHRGERLHRTGEGVLPRPVREEVLIHVVHLVVGPPQAVDRAREERRHDASGVVLLPLHAGTCWSGDGQAEAGEDGGELGFGRPLRVVVPDQVAVEKNERDDLCDRDEV